MCARVRDADVVREQLVDLENVLEVAREEAVNDFASRLAIRQLEAERFELRRELLRAMNR